jgi:hypothetical protein
VPAMTRLACARGSAAPTFIAIAIAFAIALVALVGAGCGKKASEPSGPPPEVTGLAAVPANAQVVIGVDVGKLFGSQVVERAVDQLLLHNAVLSERWERLHDDCKIDLGRQIKRMMLAIGPHPGPQPGTGPVILVVVGSIAEAQLKDCVAKLVGAGGGTVTGKSVFGRTLYLAKDGNRTMYFAYGKADTVVLGSNEAYITEALGTGRKAPDDAELAKWLRLVNQNAPVWAVGRTDERVRNGLIQLTEGKVGAGAVGYTAMADFTEGAKLELAAVMSKPEDAKSLESYVKGELALLTAAAQLKSLGPVVAKVNVTVENELVRLRLPLTVDDLNLLLSALDGGGSAAQDSAPPAAGSGSGTK